MRKGWSVLVGVVCLVVAGTVSAVPVGVGDISMALETSPFYQGSSGSDPGYFHIDSISILADNGILRVAGAGTYDYGISGTVTVTRCDLVQDNSSAGGQASGDFEGGAILTINGSLVDLGTSATLATGDILVGYMTSTQWLLEEPTPQDITGNAYFEPTGGALYSGVDLGGGDNLVIGDFRVDFSFITGFPGFGVDPEAFGTTSYSGLVSNVQIAPLPEPCTLMLLSLGGLAVLRSKKK